MQRTGGLACFPRDTLAPDAKTWESNTAHSLPLLQAYRVILRLISLVAYPNPPRAGVRLIVLMDLESNVQVVNPTRNVVWSRLPTRPDATCQPHR